MSQLAIILAKLEGFCENIDKKPTEKQWATIQARIAELAKVANETVVVTTYRPPAVVGGTEAAPAKKEPMTERRWRSEYAGHFCELGSDIESAKEYAREASWSTAIDPKAQAKVDYAKFTGGKAA